MKDMQAQYQTEEQIKLVMEVQLKDGMIWTISNKITMVLVSFLKHLLLLDQQVRKCWLIIRLLRPRGRKQQQQQQQQQISNTVN